MNEKNAIPPFIKDLQIFLHLDLKEVFSFHIECIKYNMHARNVIKRYARSIHDTSTVSRI